MLVSSNISVYAINDLSGDIDGTEVDGQVSTSGYNPNPEFDMAWPGIEPNSIYPPDDRYTTDQVKKYPYSAVAYLVVKHKCGCTTRGTGFMVSAKCMLTAGHVLNCMNPNHNNSPATSLTAYWGYFSSSSYLKKVDVTSTTATFYTPSDYPGTQARSDYGYVLFNEDIGSTTGWFGLLATDKLYNESAILYGYAKALKGSDCKLYISYGRITSVANGRVFLNATMDADDGESGGPLCIHKSGTDTYNVVGIYTHGAWGSDEVELNNCLHITADFIKMLRDIAENFHEQAQYMKDTYNF